MICSAMVGIMWSVGGSVSENVENAEILDCCFGQFLEWDSSIHVLSMLRIL